jgi:hypothetical protein
VSVQDEPKGNAGHAKGMASAVYPYTSERGNTYPRLDLSIDYRDPKHIRLRAYDAGGHVVDTLGCNDIAETLIWAGATIRYAETMYARRLRKELDAVPSQDLPADSDVFKRTRQLMTGTDEVTPTQAEHYEELLQPGGRMLELLEELGVHECCQVAAKRGTVPLEVRREANALMGGRTENHVWFRGICAYAVAAGHIR